MPDLLYDDLNHYVSSAAFGLFSDLVTPIVGNGALIGVRLSGTAALAGNFAPTIASGVTQGITRGSLRILLHATDIQASSDGGGLLCMQSQRDLTAGGNAYAVRWYPNDASSGFGVSLLKFAGGLLTSPTVLAGAGNFPGDDLAMRFVWMVAEDSASVLLQVFVALGTDFTSLSQVISYVDSGSPLTSTTTEGGWMITGSGVSTYKFTADEMTLQGV